MKFLQWLSMCQCLLSAVVCLASTAGMFLLPTIGCELMETAIISGASCSFSVLVFVGLLILDRK